MGGSREAVFERADTPKTAAANALNDTDHVIPDGDATAENQPMTHSARVGMKGAARSRPNGVVASATPIRASEASEDMSLSDRERAGAF